MSNPYEFYPVTTVGQVRQSIRDMRAMRKDESDLSFATWYAKKYRYDKNFILALVKQEAQQ
ncbi:hypothetical protein D3C74_49980 [compost metagenome]